MASDYGGLPRVDEQSDVTPLGIDPGRLERLRNEGYAAIGGDGTASPSLPAPSTIVPRDPDRVWGEWEPADATGLGPVPPMGAGDGDRISLRRRQRGAPPPPPAQSGRSVGFDGPLATPTPRPPSERGASVFAGGESAGGRRVPATFKLVDAGVRPGTRAAGAYAKAIGSAKESRTLKQRYFACFATSVGVVYGLAFLLSNVVVAAVDWTGDNRSFNLFFTGAVDLLFLLVAFGGYFRSTPPAPTGTACGKTTWGVVLLLVLALQVYSLGWMSFTGLWGSEIDEHPFSDAPENIFSRGVFDSASGAEAFANRRATGRNNSITVVLDAGECPGSGAGDSCKNILWVINSPLVYGRECGSIPHDTYYASISHAILFLVRLLFTVMSVISVFIPCCIRRN